jgi:hypothetical protein
VVPRAHGSFEAAGAAAESANASSVIALVKTIARQYGCTSSAKRPAVAEEAEDPALEAIAKAKGFMSLNAYAESMRREALEGLWLESGT